MHCFHWMRLCCMTLLLAYGPSAVAQQPTATYEQVQAAADVVRADPNLPGTETTKTLRWKKKKDEKESKNSSNNYSWWRWMYEMGQRMALGARWLMWLALAALAAFVLVRLPTWLRLRGERLAADNHTAPPAHVGALDIRPASLPADIGHAAALLWQRGQTRAALSLLYRGSLSRLVHLHGVPIRAASTEGECLHLAAQRLSSGCMQFFHAVVQAWQGMAWGHQLPSSDVVLALCDKFEQQLSPVKVHEEPVL